MFTGIIEEMGTIQSIKQISPRAAALAVRANKVLEDVHIGDSIAVNGVCLTVTNFTSDSFQLDVMPETIRATSLNSLSAGAKVNLERSMAANGRFGGHFVSGHVDGTGKIVKKQKRDNAIYYTIAIPGDLAIYFMEKGSVAVDGISLTVFEHTTDSFTVSLIPHTAAETVLGEKESGDIVNIECDMLAKYIRRMWAAENAPEKDESISRKFLAANGFV
jgi:riboflavin synthase